MLNDAGGIISYEDAYDHVGRELFGDEWDITLSDDEWSEYDAAVGCLIDHRLLGRCSKNQEDRATRKACRRLARRARFDQRFHDAIQIADSGNFSLCIRRGFRGSVPSCGQRVERPKERLSDRGAADCKRWLEDLVRSSPDRNPTSSKKATSFQAKRKFGVSGHQFYSLWNEVMKARPDAKWTKRGRRSDSTSRQGE